MIMGLNNFVLGLLVHYKCFNVLSAKASTIISSLNFMSHMTDENLD